MQNHFIWRHITRFYYLIIEVVTTSLPESKSKVIAFISIFSALIVVFSLLSIPLPQPIAYIGMASIAVLMVGLIFNPKLAFVICMIGGFLGELIADLVFGYGVIPPYLLGAIVAKGLEGPIISLIAGKGASPNDFGKYKTGIITNMVIIGIISLSTFIIAILVAIGGSIELLNMIIVAYFILISVYICVLIIISKLKGSSVYREFAALIVGTMWELFGYILIGWWLIYSYLTFSEVFLAYFATLIDIVWILIAFPIVFAVRRNYDLLKLEELIYSSSLKETPENESEQAVQEIGHGE